MELHDDDPDALIIVLQYCYDFDTKDMPTPVAFAGANDDNGEEDYIDVEGENKDDKDQAGYPMTLVLLILVYAVADKYQVQFVKDNIQLFQTHAQNNWIFSGATESFSVFENLINTIYGSITSPSDPFAPPHGLRGREKLTSSPR